jgi:hypothetical protein
MTCSASKNSFRSFLLAMAGDLIGERTISTYGKYLRPEQRRSVDNIRLKAVLPSPLHPEMVTIQ